PRRVLRHPAAALLLRARVQLRRRLALPRVPGRREPLHARPRLRGAPRPRDLRSGARPQRADRLRRRGARVPAGLSAPGVPVRRRTARVWGLALFALGRAAAADEAPSAPVPQAVDAESPPAAHATARPAAA